MPITKHNFTVRKVEELADTMRAAFRIAQSGRKGPVLVDYPQRMSPLLSVSSLPSSRADPLVTTATNNRSKWARRYHQRGQTPAGLFWRRRAERGFLPGPA